MTGQPEEARDPVTTAADLTSAVTELVAEVKRLRWRARRNLTLILFDVLLTAGLAAAGAISVHAVQSADNAQASQTALCESGNVARAQQVQLWDFLLDLPPVKGAPPATPAQKARIAAFRAYLVRDFAPRNCAGLVRRP